MSQILSETANNLVPHTVRSSFHTLNYQTPFPIDLPLLLQIVPIHLLILRRQLTYPF